MVNRVWRWSRVFLLSYSCWFIVMLSFSVITLTLAARTEPAVLSVSYKQFPLLLKLSVFENFQCIRVRITDTEWNGQKVDFCLHYRFNFLSKILGKLCEFIHLPLFCCLDSMM